MTQWLHRKFSHVFFNQLYHFSGSRGGERSLRGLHQEMLLHSSKDYFPLSFELWAISEEIFRANTTKLRVSLPWRHSSMNSRKSAIIVRNIVWEIVILKIQSPWTVSTIWRCLHPCSRLFPLNSRLTTRTMGYWFSMIFIFIICSACNLFRWNSFSLKRA